MALSERFEPEGRTNTQPERKLVAAIILQALSDVRISHSKEARLAHEWLRGIGQFAPSHYPDGANFSFAGCCEHLDIPESEQSRIVDIFSPHAPDEAPYERTDDSERLAQIARSAATMRGTQIANALSRGARRRCKVSTRARA